MDGTGNGMAEESAGQEGMENRLHGSLYSAMRQENTVNSNGEMDGK